MPRYYFDTSALVKDYHAEAGTIDVHRILANANSEFLISRLATVEMLSGFAGKVRTGLFLSTDYSVLRRRFLGDVRSRLLQPIRLLNADFLTAGSLIGTHAMYRPLRTLDAIQLAVALRVHRSDPIDHFVCADQRLCDVADMEGMTTIRL